MEHVCCVGVFFDRVDGFGYFGYWWFVRDLGVVVGFYWCLRVWRLQLSVFVGVFCVVVRWWCGF